MKTTIDIADDLIRRAKVIQTRDDVTLRALIEDGLRDLLDKRSKPQVRKFVPVVVGGPKIDPSFTPKKLNRIIDEMRDRPSGLDKSGKRHKSSGSAKAGGRSGKRA